MTKLSSLVELRFSFLVPASKVQEHRIFGARFVNIVQNLGLPKPFNKIHLAVQSFNDQQQGLLTQAPPYNDHLHD